MSDTQHAKNKTKIVGSGFFVLRTPLLPFDEFLQWGEGVKTRSLWEAGSDPNSLEQAWLEDVRLLRSRLGKIIARPEILQALFVASPSLESGIEHWTRQPENKKGLQAERSLVRYFARMSGRPTPFGLFSGCSVGRVTDDTTATELVLQSRQSYRSSCRLDFDYLFALTQSLRRDPSIVEELRYWPNSSLYRSGDSLHYIESRVAGNNRTHHVVRINSDEYLDTVLARASSGVNIADLIDSLSEMTGQPDFSREEIREYLQELIDSEVLVSSLSPLVTGGPPLDEIIAQLQQLSGGHGAAQTLQWARERMEALDSKGLGADPVEYREIATKLETLSAKPDITRLYQVDMTKPLQNGLIACEVLEEISSGVEALNRLAPMMEPDELRLFREAFSSRYEMAWIPLLEALDPEAGIGFGTTSVDDGSPLLRGLPFRIPGLAESAKFLDAHAILLHKVVECAQKQELEVVLELADLPTEVPENSLARSFSVTATLVAASSEAIRTGDYEVLLRGSVGPSAARFFGRFCHADAELDGYVRDLLKNEEAHDKDAVYAEIVYLPEGRIGNVLCRPVFRDYEITYLGRSGAPQERQIAVSDLLVSVAGGEIRLYSQRLGRRVVPRMTNAHGFMNAALAPVYRFLCYLQHQSGVGSPGFGWGPLEILEFLPRLRIGRAVLACAQWRISAKEIEKIKKIEKLDCFIAVQELRRRRALPRWIVLQEFDNALPVDLDNPLSVDAFVHVLKRLPQALVQEMYPSPEELCVNGPEGRFQHELIVPFVKLIPATESKSASASETKKVLSASTFSRAGRIFPPGSDWLYVKLYGGVAALDDVLTGVLPSILRSASEAGIHARWFFIRYADPHHHLRVRFNANQDQIRELLPLLESFNPSLMAGSLWKVQFDTYEREIERYGGLDGIRAAEDIFFADSDAVVEILQALQGDEGLDDRWRIAALGTDRLLSDCGFDLDTKRTVVGQWRSSFEREFSVTPFGKKQLGDRFRRERNKLQSFLEGPTGNRETVAIAKQAFERRSVRVMNAIRELQAATAGGLNMGLQDLASSYAHMHINRLIRSAPRTHELVLYDFLFRIYDGLCSRGTPTNFDVVPVELDA